MMRSSNTVAIELLPAKNGDAVLLTWGPQERRHRLLVDGGPARAYTAMSTRLAAALDGAPLDLLVLTHIDADHIEGTMLLTNDAGLAIDIGEIWFNGPAQISDELSAAQGEMFAALIAARAVPLNAAFDGAAVHVPDEGCLPTHDLQGLRLTVLAPDARALRRLRDRWNPALEEAGLLFDSPEEALSQLRRRPSLIPDDNYLLGPPETGGLAWVAETARATAQPDDSVPNASSIALLAEFAGVSVLLAGDATSEALEAGIRRLLEERGLDRLELTAFKLPHHGSVRNVTRELLELAPAEHYLFSSDSSRFGHPDAGGVARVLCYGRSDTELVFNYRTPQTLLWNKPELLGGSGVRYPATGEAGVQVVFGATPERDNA